MNDLFFRDLNAIKRDGEQYNAFKSLSNTVVIAGPGSGKTRVLALKAVTLARTSIKAPCGLACISFSRETVRELKKRLKLYGFIPTRKDFVGTVHSFSLTRIIQPFGHLYPQYKIKYPIRILPDEVRTKIYNGVLKRLGITDARQLSITDINKHRSLALLGKSTVKIRTTQQISEAAALYQGRLDETDFIDYVDVINIAAKIVQEQPYVQYSLQSQFPWLLVDEYQDLGKALHEMVLELTFHVGIKLYAVGDANQSIYGFNGGYPDFLNELMKYDDIDTFELTTNYRSSQHIIDASLETLELTPPYPKYVAGKRMGDVADFSFISCKAEMFEQYEVVAKKVIPKLISNGVELKEIAIITGSNSQIHEMAAFVQKENFPFFIANWDFENSAVIVWLQECALWCNRGRQSFEELFNFWRRLIKSHKHSLGALEDIRLKTLFFEILNESANVEYLMEWLEYVIIKLRLKEILAGSEVYPNEVDNIEILKVEAKLRNLKGATTRRFANLGFPENEITITTRHSSKGLEFEAVILLGMEEERFPNYYHIGNPVALAEDQRLCYVCISRAKRACILLRSQNFTLETKRGPWYKPFAPSRFWVGLYRRFGNEHNTFTNDTYA